MSVVVGSLLIAITLAFNGFFAALTSQFRYPEILREPTADVLAAFRTGGTRLVSTWWGFATTAVAFAPVVVLLSSWMAEAGTAGHASDPALLAAATTVGVIAAMVQALGLMRWPFMVPHLARESEHASPAKAEAIDVVFQSFHRYLGVAIGEHLGYLLTGAWTILVSVAALQSGVLPAWIGVAGLAIGAILAACSLEFVGPFERDGWALAGRTVPFAYIAWSLWLAGLGVLIMVVG